jgi:hypothetical protein
MSEDVDESSDSFVNGDGVGISTSSSQMIQKIDSRSSCSTSFYKESNHERKKKKEKKTNIFI